MHESWERRYPEFETRMEILTLAEQRRASYSEAADIITAGNDAVDSEQYDAAREQFQQGLTQFEEAGTTVQRSVELLSELSEFQPADLTQLESHLDAERTYIDAVIDSLGVLVDAAELLAAGEDGGVERYNEGIHQYNETLELDIPDGREYVSAVGFVTA
jgi:hypothetical protein